MTTPRFEIRKGRTQFHWVLIAKNGEVLCSSETFPSKARCKRGITSTIELVRATGVLGKPQAAIWDASLKTPKLVESK